MGCLFAGLLAEAGRRVTLLTKRPEEAEHLRREGLRLEGLGGSRRVTVAATANPQDVQEADLVLLAVKAYDTQTAVQTVAAWLKEQAVVLTLQNGLGNVETVSAFVGAERTLGGVTAHGATRLGVGHVRHAGRGETVIGEARGGLTSRVEHLADLFTAAGIETRAVEDIRPVLWGKLLVNVGINALAAVLQWRNGQLIEHPATERVLEAAVTEAVQVAQAEGLSFTAAEAVAKVKSVCKATAQNLNSMLQDLQRGRQTEVDYLNGAIVAEGEKLGVPTPINWTLTQLVKALEP